jgi:hypothetical protein
VSAGMVRSSVLLNKCDDLSAIYHLLQASNTQQAIINFLLKYLNLSLSQYRYRLLTVLVTWRGSIKSAT